MWYHDYAFPVRVGQWRYEAVVRVTRARWAEELMPGWSKGVGGPFAVGLSLRHDGAGKPTLAERFPGLAKRLAERGD